MPGTLGAPRVGTVAAVAVCWDHKEIHMFSKQFERTCDNIG